MKKINSILAVAAVSSVLVFGFGAFDTAKAVPGTSGERISSSEAVDMVGVDRADNSLKAVSRDSDSRSTVFVPDTYGLHGTLRP